MERFVKLCFGIVLVGHMLLSIFLYEDVCDIFPTEKKRTSTKYIVIHHTACPLAYTVAEIDDYHRNKKGWGSGFAYHFYLKGCKVYKVHELEAATGHALSHNFDAIAVCVSGDFDREVVSKQTEYELYLLVHSLKLVYPDAKIVTHGELNKTSCCGANLQKIVKKWQKN